MPKPKVRTADCMRNGLTNRLTKCILIDDRDVTYQYSYQKTVKGTDHYSCSYCRKHGHPCSTLIIYANGEAKSSSHHPLCDPPTKAASTAEQAVRRGRLLAANGTAGDAAYFETFKDCKERGVDIHLKPYAFHRKQICRWARRNYAPSAMGYINKEYHTLFADDTEWLDYDDGNLTIFATDRSYAALAKCRIAAADSTFSTSPTGVDQTFVLHGFVENEKGGEWVPLIMALMKNRDEKSYQKIADQIKEAWERLNVKPEIERLHLDYEAAEGNAFKNLLGEDKIYGCLFHYSQIILRRLTKSLYQAYCMNLDSSNSRTSPVTP
uniref:MULE transposase domain-containing protein n=1 Tax=Panagrolaimus superbus TaxID=310955 RepID=A0A914YHY0_9BILA